MNPFYTDSTLFSPHVNSLLEIKNLPTLFEFLKEKHKYEIESERKVIDKKNDLLIWNAFLTKHITEIGIFKIELHPIYNKYYKEIQVIDNLNELQTLEIKMFENYVKSMKSDILVKENYSLNKILFNIHMNIENYVSLKTISSELSLSESYISTLFKKHMNISVMNYVKKLKIDRAKKYLIYSNMSILEISVLLGFYDTSHFSKLFKDVVGITPSDFRNHKL